MSRVLILGCGRLGYPLAQQLLGDGHAVTGISRNPPPTEPSSLNWLRVDITEAGSVATLPTDVDLIVLILTPAARNPQGYEIIYQHGLDRVLACFDGRGSKPAVIFVSATSVYGQDQGEWVDENSTTEPVTYNGNSLLRAERAIHKFCPSSVVIRFSGIYGFQRTRLLHSLQQPQEIQAAPPLYTNRIHEQDCVAVLAMVARKLLGGDPVPACLLASDHDPAPKFEMMCWLAKRAGLVLPTAAQSSAGKGQNKRASNRRLIGFGYEFRYPTYREGYAAHFDG